MDGRGDDEGMHALLEGLGLVEDLEVVGASHDARAGPAPANNTLNPEGAFGASLRADRLARVTSSDARETRGQSRAPAR